MRKLLSCILLLSLVLTLCACGAKSPGVATGTMGFSGNGTHVIMLTNANVDGATRLEVSQEGTFLAKAVLPDRETAVDYWTIDGQRVDAGNRSYSLEFDSEGVSVVNAVLRERKNVTCTGAYLQFLDENGNPAGPMYQKVYFEDNYVIPHSGEEHPGGIINCYIGAKVPAGKSVDYWIINGTAVQFDGNVTGFTLYGLDRPLHVEVVFKDGDGTSGHDLIFTFDPNPNTNPKDPDDNPYGWEWDDEDDGWVPYTDPDTPGYDPTPGGTPTGNENGHTHNWVYDPEHSWLATCEQDGRNTFKCTGCDEIYYQDVPGGHQYHWVSDGVGAGTHTQVCSRCGGRGVTESHVWLPVTHDGKHVCSVCFDYWYEIN